MYCSYCGVKHSPDDEFCNNCGKKIEGDNDVMPLPKPIPVKETVKDIPNSGTTKKGVFCPRCHSNALNAVSETETNVSGGGYGCGIGCCGSILLGPLGLLLGLCGRGVKSDSTTRHFWMCKSCGHKFRNAEDEYKETLNELESVLAICVLIFIGGIIFTTIGIHFFWIPGWVYILLGLIGTAGMSVLIYFLKKEHDKNMEDNK